VHAEPMLAAPTPRTLYIHDDLTDVVRASHGDDSEALRHVRRLFEAIRAEGARISVLSLAQQIDGLVAQERRPPFDVTVGIGRAGERAASQLHARTGWFPRIRRVELARQERADGGYNLVTPGAEPLPRQLEPLEGAASVALVDDTVFSGLTMHAVLQALPLGAFTRVEAFCLRAVAQSLTSIAAWCPVAAGFVAPGRLLTDVSFINASGLVLPGAIRCADGSTLAFYERPEWMRAWFPLRADHVTACGRALRAVLEAPRVPA
jgi:hypothetical protein